MYADTIANFAVAGAEKAHAVRHNFIAFLIGAVMAGAYIGFGDIIMFTVAAHVDPAWIHLVMGVVFSSALTIVVFAGSELFTGTAMYMPLAVLSGRSGVYDMFAVWVSSWVGNLLGAILLASLFHLAGGGVLLGDGSSEFFSVVTAKMAAAPEQLFARGILCNWLVCLAIWMAARTDNAAAKVMLIFWPITIFVAAGYEHSVANMFTFAMALLGEHPATVSLTGAAHNLLWVTAGNLVGGSIFVAAGYWMQARNDGHVSFTPVATKSETVSLGEPTHDQATK
ncbi:formate/nitrite transporter family protein [Rhizobium cauense]|uniref:formate/nitrite transporter family protein n=1 Tax=Rhizobium cauense TaxID=1166683 RepID=UPI001C6EA475|nr:formate/nitrite transporter family protein [Rhizobium cauense]MBW9116450.1 formate/nitrite transporter family protein [Rhizobium cauense]